MASIETLVPLIYHEKQQSGSMLCAQHALNSLLQGHYFTAPDLSTIARSLDDLEGNYDEDRRTGSTNMDDTGFFSIQVLERALQVWGLTLVRWRSERMRPYQDHPHTQMGFILNSHQHWYTLRRFGNVSPDPSPEADTGNGHWFNLNSFLPKPERVGKLYLGMVLQQAETEGYSVFAVVQMNVDEPLALPRVEADDLAASIPEDAPSSSSSAFVSTSPPRGEDLEGFEDEDFELQAALQASLMGSSTSHPSRPSEVHVGSNSGSSSSGPSRSFTVPFSLRSHNRAGGTRTPTQAPARSLYPVVNDVDDDSDNDGEEEERFHTPPSLPPLPLPLPYHPTQFPPPPLPRQLPTRSQTQPEIDPVEASRLRSQAFMDHVLRQQQQAFQEQYMVEAARTRAGIVPPRSARQVTEEEELQRAIEESRALAEAQGHPIEIDQDQDHENDNNVDEDEDIVVVEAPVIPDNSLPRMNTGGSSFNREVHRVYDDDDAELQAALKASLESVPEGFRIPSTPPRFEPSAPLAPSAPLLSTQSSSNSLPNPNQATSTNNMTARPIVDRTRSVESESQTDGEYQSETDVSGMEEEEVPVSVEEMRRRRLAKFGG